MLEIRVEDDDDDLPDDVRLLPVRQLQLRRQWKLLKILGPLAQNSQMKIALVLCVGMEVLVLDLQSLK